LHILHGLFAQTLSVKTSGHRSLANQIDFVKQAAAMTFLEFDSRCEAPAKGRRTLWCKFLFFHLIYSKRMVKKAAAVRRSKFCIFFSKAYCSQRSNLL
jgi:hypothetical protein